MSPSWRLVTTPTGPPLLSLTNFPGSFSVDWRGRLTTINWLDVNESRPNICAPIEKVTEMPENIAPGDVVQLKSGGPLMTVDSVSPFNGVASARCVWFDGSKQDDGVFAVSMLNKDDGNVRI